jgi:hypothetical protein
MRVPWDQAGWLWEELVVDGKGDSWLVAPVERVHLIQLVVLYMAAFSLGTLVRYHPSLWLELSAQPRGDRTLPLLRAATEVIETTLPELLIRHFRSAESTAL